MTDGLTSFPPRVAITCGEPAGIGPDITLLAALRRWDAQLIAIGDSQLLAERARQLGLTLQFEEFIPEQEAVAHTPGHLLVQHIPLARSCSPGLLDTANATHVLQLLDAAVEGLTSGCFQAMVTAPVQKSIINDAGIPFSGHTEYLAAKTGTQRVVMMLATPRLRVALATTHLPLSQVPAAITMDSLDTTLRILHTELRDKFGLPAPHIAVLGLNPHAGEGGHLGREEIEVIEPVMERLRAEGMQLTGPLPADTAFNPDMLARADAFLAMYHDQGLPVLKFSGFGEAVNITLGLPMIRTSVDHGTALDLAASGRASATSMAAAIDVAVRACKVQKPGT